jgi:hypothetical protein
MNKRIKINFETVNDGKYEVIPKEKIAETNARIKENMKKNKTKIKMNEYIKSIEILESFRKLEKDWNGYDAEPIPDESIDSALDFLNYLKENIKDLIYPEIYPTAQDSVQFEWSGKN